MAARTSFVGRVTKIAAYAIVVALCIFTGLLGLYSFVPPVSTLMLGRTLTGKSYERTYVRLTDVAPVLVASVIASEDAQFCRHGGVDWGALRKVIDEADEDGPSRGASTITMQTAKNLFLWHGRSKLRKGLEIGIALVLGKVWSRAHTLEVYLNIAEWGDGLFGIEAASQHYFKKRASLLNAREAALLTTSLPNPILRNAARPRPFQNRLAARIAARARGSSQWLDCLPR